MIACVEAVAAEVGDVDASDERDLAVHHHGLLVMTVERVLAGIGLAADPGPPREHVDGVAHLATGGAERGHRCSCPDENPHVESLGRLGQHRAERARPFAAHQVEVRREVPAGHVDEVACALDRIGDRREGLGAVDQHVHRATVARRRIARSPKAVVRGRQRLLGAQTPKPPTVLCAYDGLDSVSD